MFARLLIKTSAHTDPDAYRWLGFGADAVKPAPFRGGDGAPSCLVVKGRGTVLTGLTIVHVICAAERVGRSEAVQVRRTSALLCSEAERSKTNHAAHRTRSGPRPSAASAIAHLGGGLASGPGPATVTKVR